MILALGLSILTWNKLWNAGNLVWFGGQSVFFGYETLKNPEWKPDRNFRVISLFETPPSNITAGFYGFDSYDGQGNLRNKAWDKYWFEIMRRDPRRMNTQAHIKWPQWNGETYDINKHVQLDFLKIANVRYLISALPLAGNDLKALSIPLKENWAKVRPDFFDSYAEFLKHRLHRIIDPGDLFIYEIHGSLPRVFAGRGIEYVSDAIDDKALHKKVAVHAPSRTIVVREKFKKHLKELGQLSIKSFRKVPDGYNISVEAPEGGALILNNYYVKFWEARAGSEPLEIFPANAVHMAVAVAVGATEIQVRYKRPLLREKILSLLD